MRIKQQICVFAFLLTSTFIAAQSVDYLPTSKTAQVVNHKYFTLAYSEPHEQAEWVAYRLTEKRVKGGYERTDNYRPDGRIKSNSATLSDFKGSGYDRGHLAPARAMAFSSKAMSQSFYLSNMSPQEAAFNRGIWAKLEKQVRQWANKNGEIYVITGPLLNRCKSHIGINNVCVPSYFYKVILDYQQPNRKAIGFLLPNEKGQKDLADYTVSIDYLETKSGIDFFHNLPDPVENRLEKTSNADEWDFNTSEYTPNPNSGEKSTAKRCKGKTQSGKRCQRKTKSKNQYCWQHNDQADGSNYDQGKERATATRCKGMTNDGDRCKRKTTNASGYCWQHE